MRERDREAVGALRVALAAIDNAEAVPIDSVPRAGAVEHSVVGVGGADAPRRELSEQEMIALVAAEEAELVESAAQFHEIDPDRAEARSRAAAALRRILDQDPA